MTKRDHASTDQFIFVDAKPDASAYHESAVLDFALTGAEFALEKSTGLPELTYDTGDDANVAIFESAILDFALTGDDSSF